MTTGGIFYGATGHYFYSYIDRRFPGRSMSVIFKKIAADAVVSPPIAICGTFIVSKTEGKSLNRIYNDLKDNFLFLITVDTFYYLPFQVINFYLLHPRFRYLFVAMASLFYTIFVSYCLHKVLNT